MPILRRGTALPRSSSPHRGVFDHEGPIDRMRSAFIPDIHVCIMLVATVVLSCAFEQALNDNSTSSVTS